MRNVGEHVTIPTAPAAAAPTTPTGRLLIELLLSEPQWVTLRLADLLDGSVDTDGHAAPVVDSAHLPHAAELVRELTARGLLDDGRLTSAGPCRIALNPADHRDHEGLQNRTPRRAGEQDPITEPVRRPTQPR